MKIHTHRALFCSIILLFSTVHAPCQDKSTLLFVLDASLFMKEDVKGRSKFEHAKLLIEDFINAKLPSFNLGLTVFGADETAGKQAFFSPVPPGTSTANLIRKELDRLKSTGMSPIGSALLYAGQSFKQGGDNYIILITNGVENTGGAPITAAQLLVQQGLVSRIDVAGFVESPETNPVLSGIVSAGKGMYVPCWESDSLLHYYQTLAVSKNVQSQTGLVGYRCFIAKENGFPAYGTAVELADNTGKLLKKNLFWRGIFENLPPGKYTLTAKHEAMTQPVVVEVKSGIMTEKSFIFNVATGGVTFKHFIQFTNDKAYGTITKIYHKTGETVYTGTSWSGEVDNLPEGEYTIEGYIEGIPPKTKTVTVKSGQKPEVTFQFDVGKGRISFKCFLDMLKTNVANGTVIRIYRQPYNELAFEQAQWRGTTPYLPVGLYTVEGNYKGIIRAENMEIHQDSTTELQFTFNIQQVRFYYQCFRNEQKKTPATGVEFQVLDQKGNLVEESTRWRGQFTLPEGIYTIKAKYEGKTKVQTLNLFARNQQITIIIDFGI